MQAAFEICKVTIIYLIFITPINVVTLYNFFSERAETYLAREAFYKKVINNVKLVLETVVFSTIVRIVIN